MFGNKTYDRLKFVVLIVLPALAALYLGLSDLWSLPEPEKVGTSIGLIAAFLGTLLQISNSKYKGTEEAEDIAGYIDFKANPENPALPDTKLFIRKHPDEIAEKDTAVFKVGPPAPGKKPEDIPEY